MQGDGKAGERAMAATAVRRPPAITDLATTTSRDHRHCRCSKLDWNVRQHLHGVCCTVGAKMLAPVNNTKPRGRFIFIRASTVKLCCSHKYAFVGGLIPEPILRTRIWDWDRLQWGVGFGSLRDLCMLFVPLFAELMPQWRTTPSNASTATAYGANVVAYKHAPSFF